MAESSPTCWRRRRRWAAAHEDEPRRQSQGDDASEPWFAVEAISDRVKSSRLDAVFIATTDTLTTARKRIRRRRRSLLLSLSVVVIAMYSNQALALSVAAPTVRPALSVTKSLSLEKSLLQQWSMHMKSSSATSSAVAPSMFLSSARLASCSWLSSGDITTSSRSPLPFHGRELEANLLVEQQQQQQRHERQLQRRSQGILGFAIQSDLELSVPPALRATSSRAALSSLSLHATRPSNVDSTQWNLPRSFNSPWMTSASGIWKTTSSPVAWFPWIPTQQQILALTWLPLSVPDTTSSYCR